MYRKALDMTKKAPELHAELQRQLAASGEVRHCCDFRFCPLETVIKAFNEDLQGSLPCVSFIVR